jgi:hypothetical protein
MADSQLDWGVPWIVDRVTRKVLGYRTPHGDQSVSFVPIVGSNGVLLASGDVLQAGAASSGTPGSGSAVVGAASLDTGGKVPVGQLPTGPAPVLVNSGATALVAGDTLEVDGLSSGTPGSGSAVVAVPGLDSAGLLNNVLMPKQHATIGAPAYVKGGVYFDTTLNKLRIGGAAGWETVTSV